MISNSAEQLYRTYSDYFNQHQTLITDKSVIDSNLKDANYQLKNHENSNFACDLLDVIVTLFTSTSTKSNNSDAQGRVVFMKQNLEEIDDKMKEVVSQMRALKPKVLDSIQAEKLIMEVCGGAEKYKALKEVTADNQIGYQGWILIKAEDMVQPIMRFKDRYNRKGIAVCVKSKTSGKQQVQTFYQREANTANWTSYGTVINVGGYLIENGVLNVPAFEAFKKLVNNQIESWELV